MNIYIVASVLAFLVSIILAIFVLLKGRRDPKRNAFIPITTLAGTWCLFPFVTALAPSLDKAILWARVVYIAALFTGPAFLKFGLTMAEVEKGFFERRLVKISYTVAIIFLPILFSPLLIKSVVIFAPNFIIVPGPLYIVFILFFGIVCLYGFYRLYCTFKLSGGYRRNQLKYVFIGFFIAFNSGIMHFAPAYGLPEPFPHDFLVVTCMLILAYAVVRYRLMDITVAITRLTIFGLVYTLVLGVPFGLAIWGKPFLKNLIGENWHFAPLIFCALLATAGPFIYLYFQHQAENRIFAEDKRRHEILRNLAKSMTLIRDLNKLVKIIVYRLTKTLKVRYAAIYLYDKENDQYILKAQKGLTTSNIQNLPSDSPLISLINKRKDAVLLEEIRRESQAPDIQKAELQMRSLNASCIFPSFIKDNLLGFLVLGDKLTGQIYTEDDISVLSTLTYQAALAIENAQFYRDLQVSQARLFQAQKMRSLGDMAGGMCHQINNRFGVLSVMVGDLLYNVILQFEKLLPPLTDQQRQPLDRIKERLKHMEDEAIRGGEITRSLVRYAKATEEMELLYVKDIIEGAMDMVKYKVPLEKINISIDIRENLPQVKGNLAFLQDTIFNLVDNAYDAIESKKSLMQLGRLINNPNYKGSVSIKADSIKTGSAVTIAVTDDGIGMTEETKRKLFVPFFTDKATSEKGTGLGLFVISKLVESHGGNIYVETMYGKGTTFTIELSVPKEKPKKEPLKREGG